MSPLVQRRWSLGAGLGLLLLAGSEVAFAQTAPALNLRRDGEHLWVEFEIFERTGHFQLLTSSSPDSLAGGVALLTGDATLTATGQFDLATLPPDATRFVAVLHYPQVPLAALVEPIHDAPPADAGRLYFDSPDLPERLLANQVFPLTIHLNDGARNPRAIDGTLVFSLIDSSGVPTHPDAQLVPAEMEVRNGVADGELHITTKEYLVNTWLAAQFVPPVTPPLDPSLSGPSRRRAVTRTEPVAFSEYAAGAEARWLHPLGASAPLSATFAQWPGHDEVHRGVDLDAPAGTAVVAPQRGLVIDVDPGDEPGNGWVVLDHGNGFLTAMAHVVPLVSLEAVVGAGGRIAEVGSASHPHIHFELMQAAVGSGPDYQYRRGRRPGEPLDPITAVGPACDPPLSAGDATPPTLESLTLNPLNPALHSYMEDSWKLDDRVTPCAPTAFVCVTAFGGTTTSRLGLSRLRFVPDGADPQLIDFTGTASAADDQHLNSLRAGHARIPSAEIRRSDVRSRYWFPWDVSRPAGATSSPRVFMLELTDVLGSQLVVTQRYGPEILWVRLAADSPPDRKRQEVRLRASLGAAGGGTMGVQPDRYWLALDCGAQWLASGTTELVTEPFTMDGEERSFVIDLAVDRPGVQRVRAASVLLPDIQTEFRPEIADDQPVPDLVWIPPGTFVMGSSVTERNRDADESPLTKVTLTQGFWMGKYEVTQREYLSVMGENPSKFTCEHGYSDDLERPVEMVSWHDAKKYCARLTAREQAAGNLSDGTVFRLPTEAEWEYACRAGTTTAFYFGTALHASMANFDWRYEYDSDIGIELRPDQTAPNQTLRVGSFAPNAFGLFDMHGNVWEWCLDWHGGTLPGGEVTDPVGHSPLPYHVLRGGGWEIFAWHCRSANRSIALPEVHTPIRGLRVVRAGPISP